jgi:thioredoxin reductase
MTSSSSALDLLDSPLVCTRADTRSTISSSANFPVERSRHLTVSRTGQESSLLLEERSWTLSGNMPKRQDRHSFRIVSKTVSKIGEDHFEIKTMKWDTYEAKRVILATGNEYKKLGAPGEMEFYGQGVSYCATCDGNFYKNLTVAVVGGGNTAITEALYLADICAHVHILIRGDRSRAEDIWIEKAKERTNITFHTIHKFLKSKEAWWVWRV